MGKRSPSWNNTCKASFLPCEKYLWNESEITLPPSSLPLPLLPYFFSLSDFLPLSTIWTPWKGGSLYVSGKLPPYPSPKPTFCPKWQESVNVGLGFAAASEPHPVKGGFRVNDYLTYNCLQAPLWPRLLQPLLNILLNIGAARNAERKCW